MIKQSNAKKIWYWSNVIGWVLVVAPVLLYNLLNYDLWKDVSGTNIAFAGMIALAMVGLAGMVQLKNKVGVYLLVFGICFFIMGDVAKQVGASMLFIGGGLLFKEIFITPVVARCKEVYYGDKVTYTRSI